MTPVPGTPDFSLTVCFGNTPFGFAAFRHDVHFISGPEDYWMHIPSWAFAIAVLALAAFEWWLFRLALQMAIRLWKRWRSARAQGPAL